MKNLMGRPLSIMAASVILATVLAGCGGALPTAVPTSAPTATVVPAKVAPTAVATTAAATATTAPRATPTSIPTPTPVPKQEASPTPAAGQPKLGGTLRVRMFREYAPDLRSGTGGWRGVNWGPIFNQLVQMNPYKLSEISPDLAGSWTISNDGKSYTFNLLKGVKWHDGKPFTAADVEQTLKLAIVPMEGAKAPLLAGFDSVDRIEKVDDSTVRVILKFPSSSFLANLTHAQLMIQPSYLSKDDFNANPVGTGPFMLKERRTGVSMDLVKNPNFFKPGLPYLEGIKFFNIADDTAAFAAFRTKNLDVSGPNTGFFRLVPLKDRVMEGARVINYNGGTSIFSFKNVAPFTDERVRKAISLAIDRQEYVRLIFGGGGVANAGLMFPEYFGGVWGIPENEFAKMPGYRQPKDADIEEAKKLLAAAGYGTANPLKVLTPTLPGAAQDMQVMASQLHKIGVALDIKVRDFLLLPQDAASGNYEMLSDGLLQPVDDPSQDVGQLMLGNSPRLYHKILDPEVQKMYDQQAGLLDPVARKKITQQIEKYILFDKVYLIIPGWQYQSEIILDRVKNAPTRTQFYSNVNRHEQTWLE